MNLHASGEPVRVAVVMRDAVFRIAPAVVPFAVVEVDEPQALGLAPQRLHLLGPALDDVLQRLGQADVLGLDLR